MLSGAINHGPHLNFEHFDLTSMVYNHHGIFNNYSSSPNKLRVNSSFGLQPHAIDSEAMRARRIIVSVKSNYLVKNTETKQL